MSKRLAAAALAAMASSAAAQCVSLAGSTACTAFNDSSISTDSQLVGLFPFLSFVSSVQDFDRELLQYVDQGYVQLKYTNLFGCDNVNLANTSDYYARYSTSFICNSIVQNSQSACNPAGPPAEPLCADSCADFALSEEEIVSSNEFCSGRNANYADQLRADFTNCALPANSLSGTCIMATANEPDDCGFRNNLVGLCNYCRASTRNATDSCCLTSNASGRCQGVELPVFSSIQNLLSSTSAGSTPTANSNAGGSQGNGGGLSGGAIAGIVIGSLVGFALLLALIIFACIAIRRRRHHDDAGSSILNQPSPQRKGAPASQMSYSHPPSSQQNFEVLQGGRVARMNAMQNDQGPEIGPRGYSSHLEPYAATPGNGEKTGIIAAAGARGPGSNGSSPDSNEYSSPEGVASGQSEQLPFFKDYYSNDDIHPNDKVAVLWAYQPRAGDEFELERGDMLKVVGIWDDGWATGVRVHDRAEDYDGKHKLQRDSGVSHGSGTRSESPTPTGEIKAFPLVCVCLPEAWRKTVEGDSSTESGSAGPPAP